MLFDSRFLKRVRGQFPTIERDPAGKKRIFLDNGAGTLVTKKAAEAETAARLKYSANVGNAFLESKGAGETILDGRRAVADFLKAEGPENIVSGESCTSLLFQVSYALSREMKGEGNVVVTGYEHYANINPWAELGGMGLINSLRIGKFDLESGTLDMEEMKRLIDNKTKLVSVAAASNVLGSRSDLVELGKMAKENGAYFCVDAVHHAAHGPTDVKKIGCDFLVFSGYKLFSRHGSFMYMTSGAMEKLNPYKVTPSPKHGPEKWEMGTRDQAMFAAIGGAIHYLAWISNSEAKTQPKPGPQRVAALRKSMEHIETYEKELTRIVLDGYGKILGLRYIPGLTLYGPKLSPHKIGRDPTFSFKLAGMDDHELSKLLWEKYAIAVGAEDYYSRVPALYDAKSFTRATFVHYNTKEEAIALLTALDDIANKKPDKKPEKK